MKGWKETKLKGVYQIDRGPIYEDYRGNYQEIFNEALYGELTKNIDIVQHDCSVSLRHGLRGFHGDTVTTKITTCLYGHLYSVIVNNDPESDQYLEWEGFHLTGNNGIQLLVPPKFGNSFLVLGDVGVYHYLQNTQYIGQNAQFTLRWDDPTIGAFWPVKSPILSQRDASAKALLPDYLSLHQQNGQYYILSNIPGTRTENTHSAPTKGEAYRNWLKSKK